MIVVGGGTAGCVLAARLSEDPARQVLLLEAGPAPRTPAGFPAELLDAATVRGAAPDHPQNWDYPATLSEGVPYSLARGRILGGSSTINGGYFVRPRRADLDRWAGDHNDAWSYARILPLLRRLERDLDFGGSPLHGSAGPVPVSRPTLDHPAAEALREAAASLAVPDEPDKNGEQPPGFGPVPANVVDGRRYNTALTYLLAALDRPNLTVLGDCPVHRVELERGRAVGVRAADGTLIAGGEVVLAAGAIGSAQLLLLSGIGPARDLESVGVPVVQALAVGTAVDDHPQLVLEWRPRLAVPAPVGHWMMGAINTELDGTPVEVLGSGVCNAALLGEPAPAGAPLPLLVSVGAGGRAGTLRLVSADPAVPPRLELGYLRGAEQRRRLRQAARFGGEVLATAGFAGRAAELLGPDPGADDATLDAWVRANLRTCLHTCATAPFAGAGIAAENAVVDQYGRVLGVEALRVADTAILPTAPTRGPAASAVLIGELVADALRAEHPSG